MKGDQMGILAAYPTQRKLPLSTWTWFSFYKEWRDKFGAEGWTALEAVVGPLS